MNNNGHIVFLGIGSNLDHPKQRVRQAFEDLKQLPQTQLIKHSRLYQTSPIGVEDEQPDYINACVELYTSLAPDDLLAKLMAIEKKYGRVRIAGERWRARILDIDILLYGSLHLSTPTLRIPHPQMMDRLFVIAPFFEIAPDYLFPNATPLAKIFAQLSNDNTQRVILV